MAIRSKILIHFNNEKVGKERRKTNSSYLQHRYPGIPVTPIARIESRFNLSKNPTSQNDFMTATQFPIKLAFACTAHKMQGSTIPKPNPLVIDLKSVREAAQAYVMMSRVQSLQQLYILNGFLSSKIYPSVIAMEELDRLKKIACNEEEKAKRSNAMIFSLNIRSLPKHHKDILSDHLAEAQVIALQETRCDPEQENQHLALPGYNMHFESRGLRKGVVTYFKEEYQVTATINTDLYQVIKVSNNNYHVINVYCSKNANKQQLYKDLIALLRGTQLCLIVGDFNENFLQEPKPKFVQHMIARKFSQLVNTATHIEGRLLDHVYVQNTRWDFETELNFCYYSDHAAITVMKSSGNV